MIEIEKILSISYSRGMTTLWCETYEGSEVKIDINTDALFNDLPSIINMTLESKQEHQNIIKQEIRSLLN